MSDSKEQLETRISQLREEIELRKREMGQTGGGISKVPRGGYRGRGPYRRRYQNMQLVLNKRSSSSSPSDESGEKFISKVTPGSKTLVNSRVYDQEEQRIQDISEKLSEAKRVRKEQKALARLRKAVYKYRLLYDDVNRIEINGKRFVLVKGGSRLCLVSDPSEDLPDNIELNGDVYTTLNKVTYLRQGPPPGPMPIFCKNYSRAGICKNGTRCLFIHDIDRIALCKDFIQRKCFRPSCPLKHQPNQFNSPSCRFFNSSSGCSNANCLYSHKKETSVVVCRPFAVGGYCPSGRDCPLKHSWDCPDFIEYGSCHMLPHCKLKHNRLNTTVTNADHQVVRNMDNDGVSPIGTYAWDEQLDGSAVPSDGDEASLSEDSDEESQNRFDTEALDKNADFVGV